MNTSRIVDPGYKSPSQRLRNLFNTRVLDWHDYLSRHLGGDHGDVSQDEVLENYRARLSGKGAIRSIYAAMVEGQAVQIKITTYQCKPVRNWTAIHVSDEPEPPEFPPTRPREFPHPLSDEEELRMREYEKRNGSPLF